MLIPIYVFWKHNPEGVLFWAGIFWLVTYLVARILQKSAYDVHRTRGGKQASVWVVIGFIVIGIVGGMGVFIIDPAIEVFGLHGPRLQVTATERVKYDNTVTEAEARTLGEVLKRLQIFDGKTKADAGFKKDIEGYVVTFFYGKEPYERLTTNPMAKTITKGDAREISRAFDGKPVRIVLHNNQSDAEWTAGPVSDDKNK
jgi:hypothetical protein